MSAVPFWVLSDGGQSWVSGPCPSQSPGWSSRECLSRGALLVLKFVVPCLLWAGKAGMDQADANSLPT